MLQPDPELCYATVHIFHVGSFLAGVIAVKLVKSVTYPEQSLYD